MLFVCPETGETKETDICALPEGWVIPSVDLSMDPPKPQPEYGTIIAFSSEKAMVAFAAKKLEAKLQAK